MRARSPALPDAAHGEMPAVLLVVVLGLLLGIQPVTTDLYLPALPSLTEGFAASVAQAQLTLTTMLLAFGSSQLVWGPASDRFGRRPVLLAGLVAYTVAAIAAAAAPSMLLLIIARTMQGAAMGAAVVCARAIVRDLYEPETGARVMSKGLTGLGVLACVSVPLGSVLTEWMGWRAALTAVAVFGCATLAIVAVAFQETLPRPNARALEPRMLLATWGQVVRNPTFLAWSALTTASYAGLFTFLAASSFVLLGVLGVSRLHYGLLLASTAFVYLLGTILCRRLLPRFGLRRTVAAAGVVTLTGGTLLGGLALAGVHATWAIMGPFYLFMLAHGVHQPCGQSGAIGPFPRAAGAASALNGFLMMLAAFGVGGWVGARLDGSVFALTSGIWFWSACIAAVAWTLVQRHGQPRS